MRLTSKSILQDKNICYFCEAGFLQFNFITAAACCLSSSHPVLLSMLLAEFSRESLLEAGGGLKSPLSMDKVGCSNSTDVADPSWRQGATHAGTVHESDKLPRGGFNPGRTELTPNYIICGKLQTRNLCEDTLIHNSELGCPERQEDFHLSNLLQATHSEIKQH